MRCLYLLSFAAFLALSCAKQDRQPLLIKEVSLGENQTIEAPENLSDWNLFQNLQVLDPAERVFPYEVNSPLFSDYAHKARFVSFPSETKLVYDEADIFAIPDGGVLVKSFYYPSDFSKPEGERRLLETRLLVKEVNEWKAYTYIWNKNQTDAKLAITGASIPVSWTDEQGELQRINYSVPNLNQCKSCHERGGEIMPIGFSARQLNNGKQLQHWQKANLLLDRPDDDIIPRLASWSEQSELLEDRARSWLETNCAHCHRRDGPAKNSGLYLLASEQKPYVIGVNKPPVAAGRGSGGHKFAITPGEPDASILVHRIESLDPGVMMPELGRKMVHKEGVSLIREWIASLDEL